MMKLFRYLKPFRLPILVVFALVFMQSLSDLYLPTLMADIVDKGIINGDIPYIWKIGGIMLIFAAIGAICSIGVSYCSSRVAIRFGQKLRSKMYRHVQNFSLQEFDTFGTASLITRSTNDIYQVQQVLIMLLRMMISAPMMCIGGMIMAVNKDAELSLVIVVIIPVLVAAIAIIALRGLPLFKSMQVKLDTLNRVLRENLTGMRVIRSFNRTEHETKRFEDANVDLTNTAVKVNKIMAAMMPIMMLVMNFSTIAIVWFGGVRISNGDMQVGSLMAFIQYATQIIFSLIMVSVIFVILPRASASAIRINEVLDKVPEINDPSQPKQANLQRGYLSFKDVTFHYPGAEQPAISNISFDAGPGETTAIIGGTGSGKSTLLSLIPRFYDVGSGKVLLDGVDVRELSQEQLREKIGFVPQKSLLFTGTIADNIRYGKKNANDEEIQRAADIAQATEFISNMKDGFQSEIAQGGGNVSGGQKQRLSIARALVRQPEVYVFDDSFSALDMKTDAKLRTALKEVTMNATVLLVAQRVSTVMDADRIIVLDNGGIVGIGTHRELMDTCDVYREIVSSQLSEEESA
ncbi:ATP-binding cassette, subfamily B [Paenibacillus uliginis N3/975]|uniref:ATP-binding cassette, subfamily B n=1 Tax=Paenibacillus uliginis N3/975 TaxID=1313296 RepID=A0A1X7HLA4_9BACL|nr:ABC transporter ATP-binding protein [Paenibacillus uliginis]SMF88806.1 ATP-binding cassette, subfamily B [Paenibacillus uliginis N3/975]